LNLARTYRKRGSQKEGGRSAKTIGKRGNISFLFTHGGKKIRKSVYRCIIRFLGIREGRERLGPSVEWKGVHRPKGKGVFFKREGGESQGTEPRIQKWDGRMAGSIRKGGKAS